MQLITYLNNCEIHLYSKHVPVTYSKGVSQPCSVDLATMPAASPSFRLPRLEHQLEGPRGECDAAHWFLGWVALQLVLELDSELEQDPGRKNEQDHHSELVPDAPATARLEGHEGRVFEHAAFRVEKPLGSIQLRIGPSVGVVVDEPEKR